VGRLGERLFSFGVIADVQYADCEPAEGRYYREALGKLSDAVDALNSRDLAFTVNLGDIIDRDFASFAAVLPVWGSLRAPGYHVLGNHDFATRDDQAAQVLGLPAPYYQFAHAGWRFVVLNTSDVSVYAYERGTGRHGEAEAALAQMRERGDLNAHHWNGGIGREQLGWLEGALRQASAAGERVVVLAHAPLFPEDKHNLWNGAELMAALESSGSVAAYLCGHNHAGNYGQKAGVHYLNFCGVVETLDTSAYAVVHVYADRLEVEGFGREPSRVLEL
jgi:manganese-dependent ADP-ribose/CDP-alcohol diphosphatase